MLRSVVGNSQSRLSFRDKIVVFEAACTELAEVCEKMAILGKNLRQDSEIKHHLLRFLIFKCKIFSQSLKNPALKNRNDSNSPLRKVSYKKIK